MLDWEGEWSLQKKLQFKNCLDLARELWRNPPWQRQVASDLECCWAIFPCSFPVISSRTGLLLRGGKQFHKSCSFLTGYYLGLKETSNLYWFTFELVALWNIGSKSHLVSRVAIVPQGFKKELFTPLPKSIRDFFKKNHLQEKCVFYC